MHRTLKGMIVVITGASAGIGEALARELSSRGASLVLAARRLERLEKLNAELGNQHLCVQCDVSITEDCKRLIDSTVQHFGRLDTIVCNAGYGIYKRVADSAPEDVRTIFQTNVFGTTDCIYFAAPQMLKQEKRDGSAGQIMIVSSCVARRGIPFIGVYSATKAAQLSIAEALRVEMRSQKIAVTSVHPITTESDFGKVARELGKVTLGTGRSAQTAEHVARRMIAAIQRPRPEVWPSRPSRWLFGTATLFPRIIDSAMNIYRKRIERKNVLQS